MVNKTLETQVNYCVGYYNRFLVKYPYQFVFNCSYVESFYIEGLPVILGYKNYPVEKYNLSIIKKGFSTIELYPKATSLKEVLSHIVIEN